jgi:hypothetical protein
VNDLTPLTNLLLLAGLLGCLVEIARMLRPGGALRLLPEDRDQASMRDHTRFSHAMHRVYAGSWEGDVVLSDLADEFENEDENEEETTDA